MLPSCGVVISSYLHSLASGMHLSPMRTFLRLPPPSRLRLLLSLAVETSHARLSLSHPPYTPPLLSSRATTSGHLLSLFFPLGLADSSELGGVILVFGGPLSPPPPPLRYSASADYALVPVAAGLCIPLLPSSLPSFDLSSALCLFFVGPLILFPPSFHFPSFVVGATRLPSLIVCGGVVHWFLVLALLFSTLSCVAVFSGSLSRFPVVRGVLSFSDFLFLHSPSACLGPLLLAALLWVLVSCCHLIPFSLTLCLHRQRFAVHLASTTSRSPHPYCLPAL